MTDNLDKLIIQELQKNGRASNVELAKSLFASERTIRNRINRLLGKNLLTITAIPNVEAMGYSFFSIVALQINISNMNEAIDYLSKNPNVIFLANVTGRYDLIAMLIFRSPKEQSIFAEKHLAHLPGLARSETFVCMDINKGHIGSFDLSQFMDLG